MRGTDRPILTDVTISNRMNPVSIFMWINNGGMLQMIINRLVFTTTSLIYLWYWNPIYFVNIHTSNINAPGNAHTETRYAMVGLAPSFMATYDIGTIVK